MHSILPFIEWIVIYELSPSVTITWPHPDKMCVLSPSLGFMEIL